MYTCEFFYCSFWLMQDHCWNAKWIKEKYWYWDSSLINKPQSFIKLNLSSVSFPLGKYFDGLIVLYEEQLTSWLNKILLGTLKNIFDRNPIKLSLYSICQNIYEREKNILYRNEILCVWLNFKNFLCCF